MEGLNLPLLLALQSIDFDDEEQLEQARATWPADAVATLNEAVAEYRERVEQAQARVDEECARAALPGFFEFLLERDGDHIGHRDRHGLVALIRLEKRIAALEADLAGRELSRAT